jgi:hypothetical protein
MEPGVPLETVGSYGIYATDCMIKPEVLELLRSPKILRQE